MWVVWPSGFPHVCMSTSSIPTRVHAPVISNFRTCTSSINSDSVPVTSVKRIGVNRNLWGRNLLFLKRVAFIFIHSFKNTHWNNIFYNMPKFVFCKQFVAISLPNIFNLQGCWKVLSPTRKEKSFIPRILWSLEVHYHIHNSPPPVPTLAKSNHSSAHHTFDRRSLFPSWSG